MAPAAKRSSSAQKAPPAKKMKSAKKGELTRRFPIKKIHELLQTKFTTGQVKPEAAIHLTAILEYLAVEILELSTNVARSNQLSDKKGILKLGLNDVSQAIQSDEEMKKLIERCRLDAADTQS